MGLSIHYSGILKDPGLIPALIDEITDLTTSMSWGCYPLQSKRDKINGVYFAPVDCEPLFFTFNRKGELINPIYLEHQIEPANIISVKTQYAGMDAHIAIIRLIKHLREKYFARFELTDEGQYWETNDEMTLKKQFDRYESILNMFAAALENMDRIPGETEDSLTDRIQKMLEEMDGEEKNNNFE